MKEVTQNFKIAALKDQQGYVSFDCDDLVVEVIASEDVSDKNSIVLSYQIKNQTCSKPIKEVYGLNFKIGENRSITFSTSYGNKYTICFAAIIDEDQCPWMKVLVEKEKFFVKEGKTKMILARSKVYGISNNLEVPIDDEMLTITVLINHGINPVSSIAEVRITSTDTISGEELGSKEPLFIHSNNSATYMVTLHNKRTIKVTVLIACATGNANNDITIEIEKVPDQDYICIDL